MHAKSDFQLHISYIHISIFKSRLLKMAAPVMTAKFGTIYNYFSLDENSEACFSNSLDRQ